MGESKNAAAVDQELYERIQSYCDAKFLGRKPMAHETEEFWAQFWGKIGPSHHAKFVKRAWRSQFCSGILCDTQYERRNLKTGHPEYPKVSYFVDDVGGGRGLERGYSGEETAARYEQLHLIAPKLFPHWFIRVWRSKIQVWQNRTTIENSYERPEGDDAIHHRWRYCHDNRTRSVHFHTLDYCSSGMYLGATEGQARIMMRRTAHAINFAHEQGVVFGFLSVSSTPYLFLDARQDRRAGPAGSAVRSGGCACGRLGRPGRPGRASAAGL